MTTPNPQQLSYPPPHTCAGCSDFTIYLPDDSGDAQTYGTILALRPNPSQKQLAVQLYGDDFWSAEWTEYRNYFFQKTSGISFFLTNTGDDVRSWARRGCRLAQRFVSCLGEEEEEGDVKYALGVKVINEHGWSAELGGVSLPEVAWEMLLAEEDEEPDNVYSILAEKGSAAARVLTKYPINMHPDAVEALGEAKSWLEDCLQSHADCPKPDPTFTPTRLVQISPECRLCEMGTQIEPYAALSYCWGGDQVFKTTSQMLPQYKQAIDPTRLPQTLQDAIHVARQLGLHYIWIDALCIIQNSNDDKAIEIGRMAHVYGNATITIGATRASAVWNGFLSPRSPLGTHSPHKIFSLPCKYKGQDMGTVTLLPYTGEGREALDSRGWTFQERVLSPRILDFGSLRTQFTCQTALDHVPSDGWSHLPLDRPYGDGIDARLIADLLAGLYPPEEMLQHWDAIVQGFTDRSLAFATDKFPAIAGMAERYGAILNDEYCAGLWRRGMPANLLWTVDDGLKQIYGEISPRLLQGEVSAPSWSWAAVSQPVRFEAVYTRPGKDTTFCVSVEDCEIQHVDVRAPYGGVATGTLTLRAWARRAMWNLYRDKKILFRHEESAGDEVLPGSLDETRSTGIPWQLDALEEEFQDDPRCVLDVWLLLFGMETPRKDTGLNPSFFGLVVRRRRRDGERFSRVGVFHKSVPWEAFEAYMAWFRQDEKKSFVIK